MAWPYDDETAGPYGSVSQVPTGAWFPVDTATGAWQRPGQPTLAGSAGLDLDLTTAWPGAGQGYGVSAPGTPTMGQVTGLGAPPGATPSALPRPPGREPLSAFLPQQPTLWESIARGVGMATPQGRAILQGYDQQQQQQLTNRLALRRQQLVEEQETRQATQTSLETLRKISEMPNKTMRNLMFDRYVGDMQANGQPLPGDMVEAFKKSSLDEGKQMAQMLTPMFEAAGIDPQAASQILQEGGDPKRLLDMVELGLKAKKQKADEAEEARLTQSRQTLFGASTGAGTPAPAPAPTTTEPPQANVGMREAPTSSPTAPMPIRMNNPLNIKQGTATQKWVEQGVAVPGDAAQDGGRFLKFQSPSQGVQAAQDLLTGPTYRGLTVDAALKKWSGGGYGAEIVSGVDGQKKIADLTPDELTRTMGAMIKREGGAPAVAADTGTRVAGPGATGADQAQLTRLHQQIAAMDQFIAANAGSGRERTRGMVNEVQQERARLISERDKLTETGRLVERERQLGGVRAAQAEEEARRLQPLKLEQAEAGKALTPIATETAKSLANNNSIYRSLGKIETLMQDVANLPPDFINLVSRNAPEVQAALASDPAQLTGIIQGWKTQLGAASSNDPRINRFLAALGNLRDLAIAERAGASVTGNELTRATGAFFGSLPNINQAFSLFAENMSSVKERVMDQLVIQGSTVRPLSGGKAVYGALPKEVRDRIEANERGEYDETPPRKAPPKPGPNVQKFDEVLKR